MKLSLLLFSMVSILFYSTCIHLSIRDQSLRKYEQSLSLKHALYYTMNEMTGEMNEQEVMNLFTDAFFKQIRSQGDYTIHLYSLDSERGFLDVEVVQDFSFIHGKCSTISSRYQVMKEKYIGGTQ